MGVCWNFLPPFVSVQAKESPDVAVLAWDQETVQVSCKKKKNTTRLGFSLKGSE